MWFYSVEAAISIVTIIKFVLSQFATVWFHSPVYLIDRPHGLPGGSLLLHFILYIKPGEGVGDHPSQDPQPNKKSRWYYEDILKLGPTYITKNTRWYQIQITCWYSRICTPPDQWSHPHQRRLCWTLPWWTNNVIEVIVVFMKNNRLHDQATF